MSNEPSVEELAQVLADIDGVDFEPRPERKKPGPKPKTQTAERISAMDPASVRKEKTKVRNMLPPNINIIIRRKYGLGKTSYIGEYDSNDIGAHGNVEEFIKEYISPTYGGGEYMFTMRDSNGREENFGSTFIHGPDVKPKSEKADETSNVMTQLLAIQQESAREAREREAEARDRERESQRQLMQLMQTQMTSSSEKHADPNNQIMMMMMIQSMNRPEPIRGDPMEKMLPLILQLIRPERDEAFPQMPFMPQIPSKPAISIGEITSAMQQFAAMVKPEPRPEAPDIIARIAPFFPMVQTFIDKWLDGNKEKESILREQINELKGQVSEMQRGQRTDIESVMETIQNLKAVGTQVGMIPPENHSNKAEILGALLEALPQVVGFLKEMKVDNPGGGRLPSPKEQETISIDDVIRDLSSRSDEEIVEALSDILEAIKNDPKLGPQIKRFLTGNPDNDKVVYGKAVEKVLKDYVEAKIITARDAAKIKKVAYDNLDSLG